MSTFNCWSSWSLFISLPSSFLYLSWLLKDTGSFLQGHRWCLRFTLFPKYQPHTLVSLRISTDYFKSMAQGTSPCGLGSPLWYWSISTNLCQSWFENTWDRRQTQHFQFNMVSRTHTYERTQGWIPSNIECTNKCAVMPRWPKCQSSRRKLPLQPHPHHASV